MGLLACRGCGAEAVVVTGGVANSEPARANFRRFVDGYGLEYIIPRALRLRHGDRRGEVRHRWLKYVSPPRRGEGAARAARLPLLQGAGQNFLIDPPCPGA